MRDAHKAVDKLLKRMENSMSDMEYSQEQDPFKLEREHLEGLGDPWASLLYNPAQLMPQVIGTVVQEGGTRSAWQAKRGDQEYMLVAWPEENPIRAGVIMKGKENEQFTPASAMPLLEGLPNDMTMEDLYPWSNGVEAHVAACRNEGAQALWFYTPFYFRDRETLMTPGLRATVMLAGLAYGLRRALLDYMNITSGSRFELWAERWLEENPDKTRLDVPPLRFSLHGSCILLPSPHYTVYQLRAPILAAEEHMLHEEKIYLLRLQFGADTPAPLDLPLYASARVCKKYVPKVGDEIDAIVWLQGRIAD